MTQWRVSRACTHTQWFYGIEAETAEEAEEAFMDGKGELEPERENWSAWDMHAEPLRRFSNSLPPPTSGDLTRPGSRP